jgi:hypothetical protein
MPRLTKPTSINPPRPGQIGLVQTTGVWGRVIGLITKSTFTHVVVALDDGLCIGAEPRGARIRNISEWNGVSTPVWSAFELTEQEQDSIVGEAKAYSGHPYSYLDDLLIGLTLLNIWTPRWVRRRVAQTGHLQCAELADIVYETAGIHLFRDGRLPGAVYPASFVPIYSPNGWLA